MFSQGIAPEIVQNGMQIIRLKAGGITVKDSFKYLSSPLAKLPKAMSLDTTKFKKGYFPHFFNRVENQNYVGPYPPKEDYGYKGMDEAAQKEFDIWYQDKLDTGAVFNFRKEMHDYCQSDVDILREVCLKFQGLIMEVGDVDPFDRPSTIASTCMRIFQKNFLKPNTIGISPELGYRKHEKQSALAKRYLSYLAQTPDFANLKIQSALSPEGEFKIGAYKVDGLVRSATGEDMKQVIEVHG